MHRRLVLDSALDNVLAVLLVIGGKHLIWNETNLSELEFWITFLEFNRLIFIHINAILSIAD